MEEEKEMALSKGNMLESLRNEGIDTVPRLFRHRVRQWSDNVAMRNKALGIWEEITWKEYG